MSQETVSVDNFIEKEETTIYHVVCENCELHNKYLDKNSARESARNHRDLFHSHGGN